MSSLWMATETGPHYAAFDEAVSVDVAVLGGGITGLTTALLCQRAGKSVAVIDAARIASGVTGYTTAKITALQAPIYADLQTRFGTDVASAYARANVAGLETIARVVEDLDIECSFERAPAITYATTNEGADELRRELDAARSAGLDVEATDATALPFDVELALRLDGQAQFHPRRYCIGLANAITAGGGSIAEGVRATKVTSGETCVVETDHAELRAQDVVVATHIPFMFRGLFFAKTRPSRSYAIAARWNDPSVGGMYLSTEEPVRSVREHREHDGTWLIVGGESHKTGQDEDSEGRFGALRDWAAKHFGIESVDFQWSAQDPISGDGLPLIGTATPTTPHIWIATGFRKWGMTNGTAAAEIITAGIAGEAHPLADVFSPRRHPWATIRRIAGEVVDTAKHFVGDRLAVSGDGDPAVGEGVVVRRHGDSVAVYRSEDGSRYEVSAVCTHMGCLVAWNNGEQTWDCPCHGSRFAIDGSVIEGPAVRPLRSVEPTADAS